MPFIGVTNSGRIGRKVSESDVQCVGRALSFLSLSERGFQTNGFMPLRKLVSTRDISFVACLFVCFLLL